MELSAERKQSLVEEMRSLLHEYDYRTTDAALEKIIDTWFENKKDLIEILSKHPNWNAEKFHIAFDQDYERKVDMDAISEVFYHIEELKDENLVMEKLLVEGKTYREAEREYQLACFAVSVFGHHNCDAAHTRVNGLDNREQALEARRAAERIVNQFNGSEFTEESTAKNNAVRQIIRFFRNYDKETLNVDAERVINRNCPGIKVAARQKTSRALNRVFQHLGIDTWKEEDGTVQYNKYFAKYSDAINTLNIIRHTVVSVNPLDYLTMSFGNSWSSCHTIDKQNKRGKSNGYGGSCSSGTMSYLLDGSSMVVYTVDKSYDGVDYELQDKINRNMFHFEGNKLIQGRVYPQSNDSAGGIYTKFREIMQAVMAEALDVPNMWVLKRGTCYTSDVTCSYGTHYRDYCYFDNCTVSRLKGHDTDGLVNIGHNPIDVWNGEEHCSESTIQYYR